MSQIFKSAASGGGLVTSVTGSNGVTASPTTGAVVVSGVNATTSSVGVASFNPSNFTVTGGQVSLLGSDVGQTITGDSGGALSPTAGNWNILGQKAGSIPVMDTIGSASTLSIENRTWVTEFVVDPSSTVGLRGTYTTIQSAINAASSGDMIYVRPGTYVENLTLIAGITIASIPGDGYDNLVQIEGSITGTYSGISTISGCKLVPTTAGGITLSGGGGTQLYVKGCVLFSFGSSGTNYVFTSTNAACTASFYDCLFDTNAFGSYFNVSAGGVNIFNCDFAPNSGGSTIANTISGGVIDMRNTAYGDQNILQPSWTISGGNFYAVNCDINGSITTSSTSNLTISNCNCYSTTTFFTLGGSSHYIYGSAITSGTGSAVSVSTSCFLSQLTINSTNTNPITGSGTVNYCGLSFIGTSATSLINTTTQSPGVKSNDAVKVIAPGSYPYTTKPQDAVIIVDTSSARTIVPLASPVTGQMHTIKDNVGSAATNNITITPSGANIDGSASTTINIAYGSITIVFNGTQWNIV